MLATRILTAAAGIPFILVCIYYGNAAFYVMMFAVSLLCVYEYLTILKKYNPHTFVSLTMAAAFFVFLSLFKNFQLDKIVISVVVMMFVLFGIEIFGNEPYLCVARISLSFLGAFFIPLCLVHMVYIRNLDGGMELVFFIFAVVWILDTAAYAFGRMFGRHKLAGNVSPRKTVEGALAGVVFGILAAVAFKIVVMNSVLTLKNAAVLGLVIAVSGQFSDLSESIIKRDGGVKDSGKMIPGHGGVFDRFDSYIFVAPAVYYILQLLR
jgi:phosphatidate cytidylyltransferase